MDFFNRGPVPPQVSLETLFPEFVTFLTPRAHRWHLGVGVSVGHESCRRIGPDRRGRPGPPGMVECRRTGYANVNDGGFRSNSWLGKAERNEACG